MKTLSTSIQKSLDFFLYYFFLIDIYLLSFFCKKIPYLFFIFCYFFGTFGYSESLSDLQFICKFFCLVFSWYLIVAGFIVFCAFNIPITKAYLNNLLGKEFVVSKIGNPAGDVLIKTTVVGLVGVGINELGKFADGYQIADNANKVLDQRVKYIESTLDLTQNDKRRALQDSLKLHSTMIKVRPEGTFDTAMKVEAHKEMVSRVSSILFGKK